METEMKKKEQTMMCAENLKINEMRDKKINSQTTKETSGITLIALVVTILFSYDEKLKFSNSKGFLLQTI